MSPIFGRARELRLLDEGVAAAVGGQPQLVLISGPAGIGKTRLAGEAARISQAAGMSVSWGRCLGRHDRPYTSLRQELLPFLADEFVDRPDHRAGVDMLGSIDAAAEPGEAEAGGVISVLDRSQQARVGRLLALSSLTAEAAAIRPLTIVIDDLDKADQMTLGFLEELVRLARSAHRQPLNLLVVATFRATGADQIESQLTRMRMWPGVRGMALAGLADAESCSLVREFGIDPGGWDGEALIRRAQGNPLFLETSARRLRRSGQPGNPGPGTTVVLSVSEAVTADLAALPVQIASLLGVLAVLGDGAATADLADVAQIDEQNVEALLGEAAAAGVVRMLDGLAAFTHPMFPDRIVTALSVPERESIHLRAADVSSGDPTMSARHLIAAGSLVPPNRLFEAAYEAATDAAALGSWAEATHFWEAAGEAHEQVDGPNRHAVADCYENGALMSILSSDLPRASALAGRSEEMWAQAGDPNGVARSQLIDYRCTILQGEFGISPDDTPLREMADDGRLTPEIRVEALIAASEIAWMAGRSEWAIALADRAGRTAASAGLDSMRSAALVSRGTSQWLQHDLAGALASAEEAMQVGRHTGLARHTVVPAGRRAFTLWLLGRAVDAATGAQDALELADEALLPLERSIPLAVQIHQAVAAVDLDRAEELSDEALSLQRSSLDRWAAPFFLPSLAVGHAAVGRFDLARGHIDEIEGDNPSSITAQVARLFALWVRAMAGEATEADRASMEGYADPATSDAFPAAAIGVTAACAALVDISDALDLPAAAAVPGRRLVEADAGGQVMTATLQALVSRACGTARRLAGDHDGAIRHLDAALTQSADMGLVIESARAHIEMARVLVARDTNNDATEANAHLQAFDTLCNDHRLDGLARLVSDRPER